MITLKEIEKQEKKNLEEKGEIEGKLIYEYKNKKEIFDLEFENDYEKVKLIQKFEKIAKLKKIERYFHISEIWHAKDKDPSDLRRPSKREDSEEGLLISEYTKANAGGIINIFGRSESGGILFKERIDLDEYNSIFNIFEKEYDEKYLDARVDEIYSNEPEKVELARKTIYLATGRNPTLKDLKKGLRDCLRRVINRK